MRSRRILLYYDRQVRCVLGEPVYAGPFLFWSHNTLAGRVLTWLVLRQPLVSRCYGWWNRQRWSRRRIEPFAAAMGVRTGEMLRSPSDFGSFNDFFVRRIDMRCRPVARDPDICAAPADGKALAYPSVRRHQVFHIKGAAFSLDGFLRDSELAERYADGSMLIVRLHLADYHHFHFPVAAIAGASLPIEGKLHAVGPYAVRRPAVFYRENRRLITQLKTLRFGTVAMVEIGAFTVGSIRQCYSPGRAAAKGDHKGYFELGGSTVVLLFERGAIRLDEDLCENTHRQMETMVRVGEPVGRR
jgi:phosphatidylserine decarboxylase